MRQKLLSVALLVTVLVVAGCVGGAGNGVSLQETTAAEEPTAAGTTAGATADGTTGAETVTPSAETLPPGVSEDGVENASELLRAHVTALGGTGYAFAIVANGSTTRGDRTVRSNSTTNGTVAANASGFLVHSRSDRVRGNDSTSSAADVWANESAVLYRIQEENRTRYQRLNRSTGFATATDYGSQFSGATLIRSALQTGDFTVESVDRGENGTLTTLVATEYVRSGGDRDGNATTGAAATATTTAGGATMDGLNVTDYDVRMVVDDEGRVHELDMSIAVEGDRTSETVDYHYELTRLGGVTVPRPDWTADAANASRSGGGSGATTVTVTADGADPAETTAAADRAA